MYKRKLTILSVSLFTILAFAACNSSNNNDQGRDIQLMQDSASFQNNSVTDTAVHNHDAATEPSDEQASASKPAAVTTPAPAKKPSKSNQAVKNNSNKTENNNTPEKEQSATVTPEPATPSTSATTEEPKVAEKKGISKTAQGAIIGGAAGAVGGAILSKKKGAGAAVGAVVGAAAGAIIGNKKDKKEKAAVKADTTKNH